jgi:hypothetical protein
VAVDIAQDPTHAHVIPIMLAAAAAFHRPAQYPRVTRLAKTGVFVRRTAVRWLASVPMNGLARLAVFGHAVQTVIFMVPAVAAGAKSHHVIVAH